MPRPEEDVPFDCPFCGDPNSVRVEPGAGRSQRFVVDCATCCRPIALVTEADEDGVSVLEARPA